MYFIILLLLLYTFAPVHSLNFIIPLPNSLILAGTSSLVTWNGMDNITATNLYLGNGPSANQLKIISIFGQNIPSSKKSMWINMPKDAPSDNTYLILEGNDTPPSRATVPLDIGFGSKTTPSTVPTGPSSSSIASSSSPPPSSSHLSSSSSAPSRTTFSVASSSSSAATTRTSKKPSHSDLSPSTQTPSVPSPSGESSVNLSSGQTAGVTVGVIGAVGLAVGAIFFVRRNRRSDNDKRRSELFEGPENNNRYNGSNNGFYNRYDDQQYTLPPPISYSRSVGHTQSPPMTHYPGKTMATDGMRENGFQSRTLISPRIITNGPSSIMHKPDEVDLVDLSHKPHSP
ncbi:hypothetical protein BC941DRAFT_464559 [Chlamydoabsidia padenii]|nr:hypothetical protein BC941DRAFT_464559 [Chlamydoabsidia padenii]